MLAAGEPPAGIGGERRDAERCQQGPPVERHAHATSLPLLAPYPEPVALHAALKYNADSGFAPARGPGGFDMLRISVIGLAMGISAIAATGSSSPTFNK